MKPVLFNTGRTKDILDERKISTRRACKYKDEKGNIVPVPTSAEYKGLVGGFNVWEDEQSMWHTKPIYDPGDVLYVRETWRIQSAHRFEADVRIEFKAGGQMQTIQFPGRKSQATDSIEYDRFISKWCDENRKWRPSIHMPKAASRIFLLVKDVHVERLQDIDGLGAFDEGAVAPMPGACLTPRRPDEWDRWSDAKKNEWTRSMATSAYIAKLEFSNRLIDAFGTIWDGTVDKKDLDMYGWNANPWVSAVQFERISKEEALERDGGIR